MKLITTFPLEHYEISTFDAGFAFAISLILNGVEATVSGIEAEAFGCRRSIT
jgi:hypothetical protein